MGVLESRVYIYNILYMNILYHTALLWLSEKSRDNPKYPNVGDPSHKVINRPMALYGHPRGHFAVNKV